VEGRPCASGLRDPPGPQTSRDGAGADLYYAWRGGPRLDGEPGSPEFVSSYHLACQVRCRQVEETLKAILEAYSGSADFQRLSDSSQREYRRYIAKIETAFGDMPLAALDDPRVRGEFKQWRDQWADKPQNCRLCLDGPCPGMSWAKDRGLIQTNPCERGGRSYRSDRSEIVWAEADVSRFFAVAPDHLQLALLMGYGRGSASATCGCCHVA
jgi:hypothetical protein